MAGVEESSLVKAEDLRMALIQEFGIATVDELRIAAIEEWTGRLQPRN